MAQTQSQITIDIALQGQEQLQEQLRVVGLSFKQFEKTLRTNYMGLNQYGQVVDLVSNNLVDNARAVKMAANENRSFNFGWLSLLFAGQALSRTFGGLIKKQLELVGTTSLFSAAVTDLMMPVTDIIANALEPLADALFDLPEETKLAVGITITGLGVLGSLLSITSQIALTIAGLKMVFPEALAAATIWIKGLTAAFGVALAFITTTIVGMFTAWKTNFLGMQNVVSNFIDGAKKLFKGFSDLIVGIFTLDFKKAFDGLINIIGGLIKFVVNGIASVVIGFVSGVLDVFQLILNAAFVLLNALTGGKKKAPNVKEAVGDLFGKIPKYQTGGMMQENGLAYLHKGEIVTPRNEVMGLSSNINFSPTINISANVSSDVDVRSLAKDLSKYWASDFERMTKGRGQ